MRAPESGSDSHAEALPAKVAPRRLPAAVPRDRLFARLDTLRPGPLVWVHGPAGSGKTTLVSSYVNVRRLPCAWYRADESDNDPALCFSLLTQAAAACDGARPAHWPVLTPEVMPELPAFTRRFMRTLSGALPSDGVLVVDEMENTGGDVLAALLRIACDELRGNQRILVTSRQSPPSTLAHLRVKGSMHMLDWDQLRLDADEARSIAERRAPAAAMRSDRLCRLCDGWVAGYVALLDAERRGEPASEPRRVVDEQIFPYFLNEVFARVDPALRVLLLRISVLETFSAIDAQELCDATPDELARLCRENGFVERSTSEPPSYRLHPLFADFLRDTLVRQHAAEEVAALQLRAAFMLARRGEHEAALSLMCSARAWPEAAAALRTAAPVWIAQGRHVTLERTLARLPAQLLDGDPWLRHWQAMAWLPSSPHRAQTEFEAAYAAFDAAHDAAGTVSACSGVLEATMLHWSELRHLDQWGDRLRELLDRHEPALPPAIAGRAWGSVSALLMRGARHLDLAERALVKALARLPSGDDPVARFGAALRALNLLKYRFRWGDACSLWLEVQAWLTHERLPPLQRVMWYSSGGAVAFWGGDFEAARERLTTSLQLAAANDIRVLDVVNSNMLLQLELTQGRLDDAAAHLERAAAALRPHRLIDVASYDFMRALSALAQGRVVEALGTASRSLAHNEACGSGPFVAQTRAVLAAAQVLAGDVDAARATAGQILDFAQAAQVPALRHSGLLLRAWADGRAGLGQRALPALREGLALAREHGLHVVFPWVPVVMLQELGALALAHGTEPEAATAMLRLRAVPPPPDAPPEWPWVIRIRCLGEFELSLDGRRFEPGGKAPKRPLELLKALIAMGGTQVPEARLQQALWPELDGDAAHNALGVALHRLRRLLGAEQAIVVREGCLSIDTQRVWVDVRALREQLEATTRVLAADAGDVEHAGDRLMALYRGPFLAAESASWALPRREALRGQLLRACDRIGERLEALQQFDAAARCHAAVIEREPAAEAPHRGLMRCMAALGRSDDAAEAYRRCVAAVRRAKGSLPSEATQALARRLALP